jgi:hypothetical protein
VGPRRLRKTIGAIAAFLALGSTGRDAGAQAVQEPPFQRAFSAAGRVVVEAATPDCPDLPALDALTKMLALELRADGVEDVVLAAAATRSPSSEANSLARIELRVESCEPSAPGITVDIEDAATGKRVGRRIPLGDVLPVARSRAFALAVAELLRASWLELAMPDAPPAPIQVPKLVRDAVARRIALAAPAAPPPTATSPSSIGRDLELSLAVAWRDFPGTHTALYGGRATVALPTLAPWLLLRLDASGLFGAATDVLGSVDAGTASLAAAALVASPGDAPLAVAVGPRIEIGVAWASGHPADPGTSSESGVGLAGTATLVSTFALRLSATWRLAFELEGGATFLPFVAHADARRVLGLDGALVGMAIGVAYWR